MHMSFATAVQLDAALGASARAAGFDAARFAPDVRTADPTRGDFQANGVLGYAKQAQANPRALADKLVAALPPHILDAFEAEVAGPGIINFRMRPGALDAWLMQHGSAAALASGAASARADQTCIVDYSSPNTAKQMHVGHLRSAVIGEAISRLLAFSGATVVRDNHLGDWGTQFGKLRSEHRQADACRTPAFRGDRRGDLQAARVQRGNGRPRQPSRGLGHPVRETPI